MVVIELICECGYGVVIMIDIVKVVGVVWVSVFNYFLVKFVFLGEWFEWFICVVLYEVS